MKPAPIAIEEALRRLAAETPEPVEEESTLAAAAGAALAEDVASDLDLPPFDKAMMDGFAVVAADTPGDLEVVEEIPAGRAPTKTVRRGQAAKIMTGAPLPNGADAVQQVEKTSEAGGRVRILEAVRPGQNVSPRGEDARAGEKVLRKGHVLRPAELGLLATVGRARVRVYRQPHGAMFSTGDELVEPPAIPGPGQIRNSNTYSVAAQMRAMGLACDVLPVAGDRVDEIRARIREGLRRDVLVISGGVSAGERDLVIPALEAEGVRCSLHQVKIRPGRPFTFGRRDRKVVFALPGNPVSTFVTFEVFVRPFLGRMMGLADASRVQVRARLLTALPKKAERTQYLPAVLERRGGEFAARVLPWHGSADLVTLTKANALAIQPLDTALAEGDAVEVMLV